ncbi:hypothetical protein HPP92_020959 [Vanilla planifolia]|uniref:Scarecrow-like protein 15 n=1 Tax=Vanilla planifolia TaxID=51239 RepID=A0A835Q4N1_VANPL|nr:hypothetical protein HPP92_021283 [Vanilla planifolia]KAG0462483.1 hypothetical protein HPP92_020959 [Vanilla planifolia]
MKLPKTFPLANSIPELREQPKPFDDTALYEPTSVLDPHLTSSPPTAAGICAAGGASTPNLHWDPNTFVVPASSATTVDDFLDPLSWLLADSPCLDIDESCTFFDAPTSPVVPPPVVAFDASHLDLLLRAALASETGDLNSAYSILARLNALQPYSSGGTLQRATFHFKDALLSLLPIPNRPVAEPPLSPLELVRRIAAQKSLSDLSPIPQFTAFTANQTLLESLDGASSLHLIDFDLGLGGQWSSFTQEVATRSRAARNATPSIRITAVAAEETAEIVLAAENLRDFARGIGVPLTVEFVYISGIGGLRTASGDAVAVVLYPAVFRAIGMSTMSFVRRVAAKVVVLVDTECFGGGEWSFRQKIADGLEYFVAAMEAMEAGAATVGAVEETVRRIEWSVLRPRIFSTVSAATNSLSATNCREVMAAAGMVVADLSEFTESQAEWLLRRAPADGFQLARREGAMVLSWRGKELAATSAWRWP